MKTYSLGVSFAMLALALAPAPLKAAESAKDAAVATEYVLPQTETWKMTSKDGQEFRIYVSRPEGEAPKEGYPVLYVLDGNALFTGFAEARRVQSVYDNEKIGKMIIVGIGHPGDKIYDGRRIYDFTADVQMPALKAQFKDYRSGGRDLFLSFLLNEVQPDIARRYKTHPYRQSLYGHSLGGLFSLYVLYTRPEAFHTIIAASPAIWWDDQRVLEEERAFVRRLEKGPKPARISRLLLIAGEEEAEGPITLDTILLGKRMEALSKYGVRSQYEVFEEETHISVPARAVTPTLRHAMQWP